MSVISLKSNTYPIGNTITDQLNKKEINFFLFDEKLILSTIEHLIELILYRKKANIFSSELMPH